MKHDFYSLHQLNKGNGLQIKQTLCDFCTTPAIGTCTESGKNLCKNHTNYCVEEDSYKLPFPTPIKEVPKEKKSLIKSIMDIFSG